MTRPTLLVSVLPFLLLSHYGGSLGAVVLTNNGYEGVQVMISNTIPEDEYLIQRIKELFTDASAYLFKATKNRAYFRTIDVVIPDSWTNVAVDATTASVGTSSEYVIVDKPQGIYGNRPYVRGNSECGTPGWYMHLTPGFINASDTACGSHDKVIVHEWGHLRWGLFDEYPSIKLQGQTSYQKFYLTNGSYRPVTCTNNVQGGVYKGDCDTSRPCDLTQIPIDPNCKFCQNTQQTTKSSLMAHQWMDSVTDFCDTDDSSVDADQRHNSNAPNMQNKVCDGKSAWEVMRDHVDFANGNNPPSSAITDTTPAFRLVRNSARTRVLVFDVSGSMYGTKITEQATAAYFVIDNIVEIGSHVAVVQFNNAATTLLELTEVENEQTKTTIKNAVPSVAGGGTSIYHGLATAISVLNGNTEGAEIILSSDGASATYLHIIPTLISLGIKVHTIAITSSADSGLTQLADETGARSFTYLQTSQVSLADVLTAATQVEDPTKPSSQQIFGQSYACASNNDVSGTFRIDEGLGKNTVVSVLTGSSQTVTIRVTGPDGVHYSTQDTGYTVSLVLAPSVPTGDYTFTIDCTSSGNEEIRVSSSPISTDTEFVHVTSRLSSNVMDADDGKELFISVIVEKGRNPVLNASVTLELASATSANSNILQLKDNGLGADVQADDGIYAAYLLKKYFSVSGRYNTKVKVTGDGAAYIIVSDTFEYSSCSVADDTQDINKTSSVESVDEFDRTDVGEGINVENAQINTVDTTPPAKISDLRIEGINITTENEQNYMVYTFVWTAVGSDLDVGQAAAYEMRFDGDATRLRNNFHLSQEAPQQLPSPAPSGTTQTISIPFTVDLCTGTCYVALRAIDENNLNGSVSNVVTVDVDFTYTIRTEESLFTFIAEHPNLNDLSKPANVVLIAVLCAAGAVVIIGLIGAVVFYKHYKLSKLRTTPVSNMKKFDPESPSASDETDAPAVFKTRDRFEAAHAMFAHLPLKEFWTDNRVFAGYSETVVEVFEGDATPETKDHPPPYSSLAAPLPMSKGEMMRCLDEPLEIEDMSDSDITTEPHDDTPNKNCDTFQEDASRVSSQSAWAKFHRVRDMFEGLQIDQSDVDDDSFLFNTDSTEHPSEPPMELKSDDTVMEFQPEGTEHGHAQESVIGEHVEGEIN